MSREQLRTFITDVDQLMAAGASAALNNPRWRKHSKFLRELSQQIATLVPLADAVDRLVNANAAEGGKILLDLLLLTRQLRVHLLNVGVPGELTEIPPSKPWKTPLPIDTAKELVDKMRKAKNLNACDTVSQDDIRLRSAFLALQKQRAATAK